MNHKQIELTDVLLSLVEGVEGCGFSISGQGMPENPNHYDQMVSFDIPSHKPTWLEVQTRYEELVAENERLKYITDRSNAYPSIEEQLDTIFHEGLDVWKAQIQAIKDQYPKA